MPSNDRLAASLCVTGAWAHAAHDLFPAEEPVRVSRAHADLIHRLATAFEIVWATGWNDEANTVLAPLLGIAPLPEVPAVSADAQDRPAVWIDDLHTAEGLPLSGGGLTHRALMTGSPVTRVRTVVSGHPNAGT